MFSITSAQTRALIFFRSNNNRATDEELDRELIAPKTLRVLKKWHMVEQAHVTHASTPKGQYVMDYLTPTTTFYWKLTEDGETLAMYLQQIIETPIDFNGTGIASYGRIKF